MQQPALVMSFVLPGNARQLRFTGEAKAYVDPNEQPVAGGLKPSSPPGPAVALGKPRVRKATTTPPPATPAPVQAVQPVRSIRSTTNTGSTPAPGTLRAVQHTSGRAHNTPVPSYPAPSPSIRAKAEPQPQHFDEEVQTMALDRDGLDVMPGGMMGNTLRPTRPPAAPSAAAIPHFRPANAAALSVVSPHTGTSEIKPKGAPLALWIFAAVLAGILSYHLTPAVMSHFEAPPIKAG